jgi:hypothetical protein
MKELRVAARVAGIDVVSPDPEMVWLGPGGDFAEEPAVGVQSRSRWLSRDRGPAHQSEASVFTDPGPGSAYERTS